MVALFNAMVLTVTIFTKYVLHTMVYIGSTEQELSYRASAAQTMR